MVVRRPGSCSRGGVRVSRLLSVPRRSPEDRDAPALPVRDCPVPLMGVDRHADLRRFVDGLRKAPLDWRSKGFGPLARPLAGADLAAAEVRLSDLGTPMMT